MKNLVKLKRMREEYKTHNLYKGVRGFVVEDTGKLTTVCFLNDKIFGDYAIVDVFSEDLQYENVDISSTYFKEFENTILNKKNKKHYLDTLKFKEYDQVRLVRDDEEYAKYDIHCGDLGVVMMDYAIGNQIMVDFSRIDKNGGFHGDCVSVKKEDLEIVKKE